MCVGRGRYWSRSCDLFITAVPIILFACVQRLGTRLRQNYLIIATGYRLFRYPAVKIIANHRPLLKEFFIAGKETHREYRLTLRGGASRFPSNLDVPKTPMNQPMVSNPRSVGWLLETPMIQRLCRAPPEGETKRILERKSVISRAAGYATASCTY